MLYIRLYKSGQTWLQMSSWLVGEGIQLQGGNYGFFSFWTSFQVSDLNDDYEFSVQFTKNNRGLGFTISSYVGDLNSGKFHLYPIKNKIQCHIYAISS